MSTTERYTRLQCLGLMDAGAVLRWSKYPIVTGQDVLVSLPSYLRLLQVAESRLPDFAETRRRFNSIEDVPFTRLVLSFHEAGVPSAATRRRLKAALADALGRDDDDVTYYDYRNAVDAIYTGNRIITVMLSITTAIAMLICFFSLSSSMYTNINEQSKEIGVLRALGLQRWPLRRVYVYEAWVVLITSSGTGIIVGVLVAWTMALQQVLFTQLPIPFSFPWLITLIIVALSLLLAVLSSFGPVNGIVRLPIVQILRLLN